MSNRMSRRICIACAGAALLCLAGCPFNKSITFRNEIFGTLTPYPVKSEPPPPHREADTANSIGPNGTASIDPLGYNPVFYKTGVSDPTKANGVYIGLDMDEAPFMIQFKVFHYKVPPGEAGHDPAMQPILLHSGVQEVANVDTKIRLSSEFAIGEPVPPGGWKVVIEPL